MLKPLLKIAFRSPGLLVDHVDAYMDLAERDLHDWRNRLTQRLLLWAVSGAGLLLAVMFAGVALMIWAATDRMHWLLWLVPVLPAMLSLGAGVAASNLGNRQGMLANLSQQFHKDKLMIKELEK